MLAAELMSQLAPSGDEGGRGILRNEVVVLQILEWDPSLSAQIVELSLRTTTGSEQELRAILPTLERWANQRPAMAPLVASQLLSKAKSLYDAGRNAEAKAALSKALEIDPKVVVTEEHAFLCIELTDPDDAKLARCQYFLKERPQSRFRAQVLTAIVKDTTAVFDRYGRWQQAKAQPYLNAGQEAAKTLLQEFPKTERLDSDVYELAKRVADNRQYDEAIALVSDLQTTITDSALKFQIATAIGKWRDAIGKGNLPRELNELAERVTKELRMRDLTVPSALPVVISDPGSVHILRVDDGCTKDRFTIDEVGMLRTWVRDGGILWVETELAEAFGFGNVRPVPSRIPQGRALVAAISHPITEGLQGKPVGLEVSASGGVISGPQQDIFSATSNVMPLLVQFDRTPQGRRVVTVAYVFCGVRRCGKGAVVFRPTRIDTTNDAGRRFEEKLLSFSREAAAQAR